MHEVYSSDKPDEIFKMIKPETENVFIPGISHYEDSKIVNLVDDLIHSGRNVIGTALNLDSSGNPSNFLPELMALAHEVILAKAICNEPGCSDRDANRSLKIEDSFEPRCGHHFSYPGSPSISLGNAGRLEMVVGPMFASKTDSLERELKCYNAANLSYVVFKWNKDVRYDGGATDITLHNGKKIPAIAISDVKEIKNYLGNNKKIKRVAIDEGQFLSELYDFVFESIPKGYQFFITGLMKDFQKKPFGDIPKLMCLADKLQIKYSNCAECYSPATESTRVTKSLKTVEVGGKGQYQPRCLTHWEGPEPRRIVYEFPKLKA
jgi:thymidine kinase